MKSKFVLIAAAAVFCSGVSAKSLTQAFDSMDKDADGYLNETEMKMDKDLSSQMDSLDADKDGQLSETEFGGYESGGHESDSGTGAAASDRSTESPSGASEGESAQQKQ